MQNFNVENILNVLGGYCIKVDVFNYNEIFLNPPSFSVIIPALATEQSTPSAMKGLAAEID